MIGWRISAIFAFIFLLGLALCVKLFFIQVKNREYWMALAQGQQKFFSYKEGERGEIFIQDKNKNLYALAANRDWKLVFVSPAEIAREGKDYAIELARNLSRTLGLKEEEILEKVNAPDSQYELIKNKLSESETSEMERADFPGTYLGSENKRYYPYEFFASQLIGFLGGEKTGQYGIEGEYQDVLRGKEGVQEAEKGPQGSIVRIISGTSNKGADLVLNIDYNIQFFAEKLLEEAKEKLNIESGQIIVEDPNSGKILAMANFPNFNPNDYSKEKDVEIFQNGVLQKIFEPGSIFKIITIASALEEEKITPETKYVDEGFVKIGQDIIHNYNKRVWGERTMTQVLENSINTGAIFAQRQIGDDVFLEYVKNFGFFEPTGIDLQGEVYSRNEELKKGYEVNFATASFGQGIEITPLQVMSAFSAIANGGKLFKPYIVEKIISGEKISEKNPRVLNDSVISSKTARQIAEMMVNVVEKGSGREAKIPGYYIAGKTGTSQMSFSVLGIEKSGYSDKTWQTFAGFAPAFNPRFLILIKLDNPQAKTAEFSAAPIFKELAKYIIDYWQIPPDYEEELK